MIEIKLTGEDAEKYLEDNGPDVEALRTSLKTAMQYIESLEKQSEFYTKTEPKVDLDDSFTGLQDNLNDLTVLSNKIARDTAIAEETKPVLTMANTKWTKGELGIIYWAMDRPEDELNRRLDNLYKKITRTEGAIRAKLNDLNIEVIDGVMHYMKD